MHKIFVYGTLKTGNDVRGLNSMGINAIPHGIAYTEYPDYNMIDLGAFPAVTMNGEYKIKGEVWEVDDEGLEMLDAIEGYPDFYSRTPTPTTQGKAWMYFLDPMKYGGDSPEESPQITIEDNTLIWN
tara:strand:- start:828 stop:1208 length:381 start_codon:yes stop_codon:yes gene_type:complete